MTLKRTLWRKLRNVLPIVGEAFAAPSIKQAMIDQEIRALKADLQLRTPGNPALFGFKVYSQVSLTWQHGTTSSSVVGLPMPR